MSMRGSSVLIREDGVGVGETLPETAPMFGGEIMPILMISGGPERGALIYGPVIKATSPGRSCAGLPPQCH
jgi:hypothetical protein